jgi:RNA polymerase sigma-70 factor (ECF subfamily)
MENRPRPSRRRPAGAGAGDPQEQLAAAYDEHAPGLYRYALMILADASAAEDAVHEVFAKLAARGERILEIASRGGYLRSAVRNESYRLLRRRGPVADAALASPGILEPADGRAVEQEQRRALERAIGSLPPEQREVVHMKVYDEMTFQQIADELAVSINTAASRYRYAIEKLRRLLVPVRSKEGHAHG